MGATRVVLWTALVATTTCTFPGDPPALRSAASVAVGRDGGALPTTDAGAVSLGWSGRCPVETARADVVVARVAGVGLTVCDVALRAWRRTREGLPPMSARALVDELLAEEGAAALAREADRGGSDQAVAEALAEGLLRAEALAALTTPDDAAVARWYAAHADDFQRPARVRARWLVLRTQAAALTAGAALRSGAAFEDLLGQSIDPLRARDHGDLGELRREEVPAAVGSAAVEAAFALTEDGAVTERPVRVTITTTVVVRRRARARRVAGWAVVQRLGRREAEALPLESVRRRVLHRMMRERYEHAREAARTRWEERVRAQVEAAIDARGLEQVRVEAAGR